jgi:hypothetical protein
MFVCHTPGLHVSTHPCPTFSHDIFFFLIVSSLLLLLLFVSSRSQAQSLMARWHLTRTSSNRLWCSCTTPHAPSRRRATATYTPLNGTTVLTRSLYTLQFTLLTSFALSVLTMSTSSLAPFARSVHSHGTVSLHSSLPFFAFYTCSLALNHGGLTSRHYSMFCTLQEIGTALTLFTRSSLHLFSSRILFTHSSLHLFSSHTRHFTCSPHTLSSLAHTHLFSSRILLTHSSLHLFSSHTHFTR